MIGRLVAGAAFAALIGAGALAQVYSMSPAGNGAAPVQSVNGAGGDVTVPSVQRQVSGALDATPGVVSWTFPTPFAHVPTCWPSLAATNASFSFDYPTTTTISTTAVTVTIVAHPSTLAITSLVLPISLPLATSPPPGSTVTLSCVGALP